VVTNNHDNGMKCHHGVLLILDGSNAGTIKVMGKEVITLDNIIHNNDRTTQFYINGLIVS